MVIFYILFCITTDLFSNKLVKNKFQVQTDPIQKNTNIFADYDVDNLSNFLNRVAPYVCSVLDKNVTSQAFVNYELLSDLESSSILCSHILQRSEKNEVTYFETMCA